VAVSDAIGMLAHPVKTVMRRGVRKDVDVLVDLIALREAGSVVVGLPLELDGTEERSCKLARQIGAAVREKTGLVVLYVDERYTSVDAERQLIEVGLRRDSRKAVIDQQAAVLILQSYLDGGPQTVVDQES
jgi:putative Holliday junction resolvase